MIHYQRLNCAPKQDYRPPRPGRLKLSWNLHPKAAQSSVLQASDLTPWMPPVGNQDQIGACNSYGTKDGASTSLVKAGHPVPDYCNGTLIPTLPAVIRKEGELAELVTP
jgi:hypothetical protein